MDNFPQLAKDYISENRPSITESGSGVFLVRPDGVPVYHYSSFTSQINEASVSALLGGVWQAARSLSSFIPDNKSQDEFRLSFDTSSRGVYILPVNVGEDEYYLGIIYFDEVNPGLVKSRLRTFVSKFNIYIDEKIQSKSSTNYEETVETALFDNITDDEMDKLFSF